MDVGELIRKLQAINDKSIEVVFFCPECKHFQQIEDMKQFGFIKPPERLNDGSLTTN